MHRLFITALACLISVSVVGQCVPDYNFGDASFGISPDASIGESFVNGVVGLNYDEVFHILVPENSSDIDEGFPPTLPVDSIFLDYITVIDTTTNLEISLLASESK